MKKIGFIDYYLSEWHANNYPAWIEAACKRLGYDYAVAYAWAELDRSPVDGMTSLAWCKKFNVELCADIEELCRKSDVILILAPSDPDKHLGYAKKAFAFSKRTYIDKTFAPDYKTAEEIFSLAEKNKVAFFSTSALRYADEIRSVSGVERAEIFGGGSNFDEYIIHQIEMAVEIFGFGAVSVKRTDKDGGTDCEIRYADGRAAVLHFAPEFDFKVRFCFSDGHTDEKMIRSGYFQTLMEKILTFYETGNIDFDGKQTLEIMKIREKLIASKNGEIRL